jgi:hypothetical protein
LPVRIHAHFSVLFLFLSGCLEPYQPAATSEDNHYLVVDAFANVNGDSIAVTLSRTIPISSLAAAPRESGARVTLEDHTGNAIDIPDRGNGRYTQGNLGLSFSSSYRLRITTQEGSNYLSDEVQFKSTPPIDSLSWAVEAQGVQIMVSSHDPTNSSRYYKYSYVETWQYESYFDSEWQIVNGKVVFRPSNAQIHLCWHTLPSTSLLTTSTAALSEDVVRSFAVVNIPQRSQKILQMYSVLINQLSIGKQEFDYWQQLQKNTQNLNGIFDAQPNRLTGNVRNMNDSEEPVFGFFGGGEITQKRIFIKWNELPSSVLYPQFAPDCPTQSFNFATATAYLSGGGYEIVDVKGQGYILASSLCSDCRIQGGSTTKPGYWP